MQNNGAPPRVVAEGAAAAKAREDEHVQARAAKGVKIAFGSDAARLPARRAERRSSRNMVTLGMKPLAALRAATSVDAKLFGVDDKLGALEAGKLADVIAVARRSVAATSPRWSTWSS